MRLIDTHCHLQLAAFRTDANAVAARAHTAGVGTIIVGTNAATSRDAVRLAETLGAHAWATVGLHPNHLHRPHHDPNESTEPPAAERFDRSVFDTLADSKYVVAVGETGLDYFRIEADAETTADAVKGLERENLIAHIAFARSRDLPLVLHVRDAHEDLQKILSEEIATNGPLRGAIHCFSGDEEDARRYVELGFHISFSGTVTFPPRGVAHEGLRAAVRWVPDDRLLVETDAPYLAPAPLRGARNEPANVALVAQAVAALRGTSAETIARLTTDNAAHLFGLRVS